MGNNSPLAAEEIVHIAGDPHTASTVMQARSDAQVHLRYKGRFAFPENEKQITCELNFMGDEIRVTTLCVRCHQGQSFTNASKKISYDPKRGLFIEPFECTWELPETADRMGIGGIYLCRTRVAYDGKVIKDA